MVAVMALPLLLVFLFAVVDLGRVVFLRAEADTAAHAVCRQVQEQGVGALPEDLQAAALAAAPSLAGDSIRISIERSFGPVESRERTHRIYDQASNTFAERSAHMEVRSVEVSIRIEGRYLTPLGSLLASSEGLSDAVFSFSTQARRSVDLGEEGGSL